MPAEHADRWTAASRHYEDLADTSGFPPPVMNDRAPAFVVLLLAACVGLLLVITHPSAALTILGGAVVAVAVAAAAILGRRSSSEYARSVRVADRNAAAQQDARAIAEAIDALLPSTATARERLAVLNAAADLAEVDGWTPETDGDPESLLVARHALAGAAQRAVDLATIRNVVGQPTDPDGASSQPVAGVVEVCAAVSRFAAAVRDARERSARDAEMAHAARTAAHLEAVGELDAVTVGNLDALSESLRGPHS